MIKFAFFFKIKLLAFWNYKFEIKICLICHEVAGVNIRIATTRRVVFASYSKLRIGQTTSGKYTPEESHRQWLESPGLCGERWELFWEFDASQEILACVSSFGDVKQKIIMNVFF